MEAIINFIKEALSGKKLSATWIVTLGIAIGGLVWAGSFAYQEYESTMADIKKLKSLSHEKTEVYNDSAIRAKGNANAEKLAELISSIEALKGSVDVSVSNLEDKIKNGDTALESKISSGDTNLEAKISSGDANLESKISSGDANLNSIIESRSNNIETKLDREVKNIESNLASAVESLEKNITNQIDNLEKEVDKQDKAIKSNDNPLSL